MYLRGLDEIRHIAETHRLVSDNADKSNSAVINNFFTGNNEYRNVKENREIDGDFYQLGWKSAVELSETANRLTLDTVYDLDVLGPVDSPDLNKKYRVVATRAVDTCTFIWLKKDNKHALFHVDSCEGAPEEYFEFIEDIARRYGGGQAIVSLIPGEERYRDLLVECGLHVITTLRSIDNYNHIREDRERYPEEIVNVFGHLEIGLVHNGGGVNLFGDVTNRFWDVNQFPCYRFHGVEDMLNAVGNIRQDHEVRRID